VVRPPVGFGDTRAGLRILRGARLAGRGLYSGVTKGQSVSWAIGELSQVLGGVYFPIALLPWGLQKISLCLPVTHALEGLRLALLKGAGPSALWPHWLALAAFSAALFPVGALAFQWAVRRCRRNGSLAIF